jgi:Spy/CpxP family protein refolding chaperone
MSKQRILIVTLIGSLLANAFFIGFAAKRLFDEPADRQRAGILRAVGARLTKNLDEASRQTVAVKLDVLAPQYSDSLDKRRANYQQLRQLLAAPVIDNEAIEAVMIDMKNQSSDLVFTVHEKAVEAILDLPADTRARIPGNP